MLKTRNLNQAGDTIVEVLIAVVVVSVVLVGAYTISNASLRQIRMAQERGEAQKLATGILEKQTGTCSSVVAPYSPIGTSIYSAKIDCIPASDTVIATIKWDGLNSLQEEVSMYYILPPVTP